jgi:transcription elongation GreA/GreB family factor
LEAAVPTAANDEQRAELQRDLRYWRTRLATAQVAPVPSGDAVAFGTRVTIEEHGRLGSLTIVGHDEAQPSSGLIPFASPIGQALMGAEVGEDVTVRPGHTVPIVSVEPA